MQAREGKKNVIDKRDRRRGAFNVEQNSGQAMNARPKHTGSNFSSTLLSLYRGAQPAGSKNNRIHRICLSVHKLNQCRVPPGTRMRSPGSTSIPTTGDVFGLMWKIPRP